MNPIGLKRRPKGLDPKLTGLISRCRVVLQNSVIPTDRGATLAKRSTQSSAFDDPDRIVYLVRPAASWTSSFATMDSRWRPIVCVVISK
ncbi:MAG: hypothetical protein CFE26_13125 [Verrucomicrobiales bacterium VVV1]|nr:MAG: hypothetical protein CFE26_13125 [Verrucomicrobiales bacterium VVV1]